MTAITHHIPHPLLRAYAAGNLHWAQALVVAAHVSMCDDCRAALEAEELVGGLVLESIPGARGDEDERLLADVLARLDDPAASHVSEDEPERFGIYPGPIAAALGRREPRWRPVGAGIRQAILSHGAEGSARLLWIPPGRAVPDHGHEGLELTMVLQGSFEDETGHFAVGDVEVADAALEHTPVAGPDAPCICLAATEAPLRFRGLLPRILQPLLRI